MLLAVLGRATRAGPLNRAGTGLEPELHHILAASEISDTPVPTLYMPLVMRDHSPLVNGDFEDGLREWDTGRGPFYGHGSGSPQGVVAYDGGYRALPGDSNASNESLPVGYGYIAQTFTVRKRYLRLQYWVFSWDKAKGAQLYWDTFEVSVNRPPDQIWDSERNNRGCAGAMLNPEGTLPVPGDGLVFCGDRSGDEGSSWDTGGWKTVTLDPSAFQGRSITLYLAIWSREDDPEFYNDDAFWNTWAYVDNVQLIDSISGTSAPDADG